MYDLKPMVESSFPAGYLSLRAHADPARPSRWHTDMLGSRSTESSGSHRLSQKTDSSSYSMIIEPSAAARENLGRILTLGDRSQTGGELFPSSKAVPGWIQAASDFGEQ